MRIVYVILTAALLATYGFALRKTMQSSRALSPLLGWLIGLGFFVLAPLALMTMNGGYELPSAFEVGQWWREVNLTNASFLVPYAVVWTSLMSAFGVVILVGSPERRNSRRNLLLSRARLQRTLLITMILMAANWLLLIHLVGGFEAFLISHWYQRVDDLVARYGDGYVLLDHLGMTVQVVFTAAAALYTSIGLRDRATKTGFTLLIALFFLLEVVMSGSRIYCAIYLFSVFASCWIYSRKKVLLILFAALPLVILIFSAWSSVRHNLTEIPESYADYQDADFGNRKLSSLINVTEGMNVLLLMHIIQDFGSRFPYLHGSTYGRTLTSFVPRSWYPQKPQNFTLRMAEDYLPGEETSLNATALGEMYANCGPFMLVLFPVFTMCISWVSNWAMRQEKRQGLLPSVLFVIVTWTARSTVEDNMTVLALTLGFIWFLKLGKDLWYSEASDDDPTAAFAGVGDCAVSLE